MRATEGALFSVLLGVLHTFEVIGLAPGWATVVVCSVLVALSGRTSALLAATDPFIAVALGAPLGIALFACSTLFVTGSLRPLARTVSGIRSLRAVMPYGTRLIHQMAAAVWEEGFYRGVLLSGTGGGPLGVLISSLLFAAMHAPGVRGTARLVDLFLTGCALAAVFLWRPDILLIGVAHWVRNALVLLMTVNQSACRES